MDPTKRYNFSNCPIGRSTYQGANGSKISIMIDGAEYMLKFPAIARNNSDIHYSNGIASEFLGSSIFNILGLPAQKTYLGCYESPDGKRYEVVACKDFNEMGKYTFHDFGSLKNSVISSPSDGYGTELTSVVDAIENQLYVDPARLSRFFWLMTVTDAFIGNFDRHNGNWGFLTDNATGEWGMAPIFDCGSSLYPQADEDLRKKIMNDRHELEIRLYHRPLSAFKANGVKIPYNDLLQAGLYPDCDKALSIMGKAIDEKFPKIVEFINESPLVDSDKKFFTFMLEKRKEFVIDASLKQVCDIPPEKRARLFCERYNMLTPVKPASPEPEPARRKGSSSGLGL